MQREAYKAFRGSNIHKFTNTFFAVQFIVDSNINMVIADAQVRNPLNTTEFVNLLLKYNPSISLHKGMGNNDLQVKKKIISSNTAADV